MNIDVHPPRSVVGIDAGLASFACAHVERDEIGPQAQPPYWLVRGSVYFPPDVRDAGTVAEENAWRAAHLLRWLRPVLGQAVDSGAEAFHAERYEQLRHADAAAKYAIGHAVLVAASALCDPRPRLQAAGYGGPAFVHCREAKRAATGCDVATKAVVQAAARRLIGGMTEALSGMLAEYRPHLADAGVVALHALGHRERPVLVLEDHGVSIWMGERLLSSEERDLLAEMIGSAKKPVDPSDVFELCRREKAPDFAGRAVIFTGHRVAKAFGVGASTKPLEWFEHASVADAGKRGPQPSAYMAAVLPDLGGRWWSRPENARKARTFLRAAGRVS